MMTDIYVKKWVIIYGAHLVALECYRDLCESGYGDRFMGFAVSDMRGNPLQIDGKSVKEIEKYKDFAKDCLVILAVPAKYHAEIEQTARRHGFTSFKRISLEEMSEIKGKRFMEEYGSVLPFDLTVSTNDPTWLDAYASGAGGRIRCKFPTLFYLTDSEIADGSTNLYDLYMRWCGSICEISSIREKNDGNKQYKF